MPDSIQFGEKEMQENIFNCNKLNFIA